MKQKPWREAPYLLACSQAHLPRNGASHSEAGPPMSVSDQGNVPTDMLTVLSDGSNSLIEIPYCQVFDNQD